MKDLDALTDLMIEVKDDPYKFAQLAFPWGKGTLKGKSLDVWQASFLKSIGEEIAKSPYDGTKDVIARQFAVVSGHGVGKSALSSIVILWIMSTRPHCKGTVTANTSGQLSNKTWSELNKWWRLCITKDWFEYHNSTQNMSLVHREDVNGWRCDGYTCKEENSESFAGQHADGSSSWYLFDEASAIPDIIWEVADGGKISGEPFHFVFGNPTKKSGQFFECFNNPKSRWHTTRVDSRDSSLTNHEQIAQWAEDWGEDSDRFKVRVRGLPPDSDSEQFINSSDIYRARNNTSPDVFIDDVLICGVDVARGGEDSSIIQFRKGNDARTYPQVRVTGERTKDLMDLADVVAKYCNLLKPSIIFIDATGVGAGAADRIRQLGFNAVDVNFGNRANDTEMFKNRGSEMWYQMREWLKRGGSLNDTCIELLQQLASREYSYNEKEQLIIESKKYMKAKGIASPDDADALALTFAYTVSGKGDMVSLRNIQPSNSPENIPINYANPLDSIN